MNIVFTEATKEDVEDLIRLRIAYMIDDFGKVSDNEKECMQKQLADYLNRKLGDELIVFTARDGGKMDTACTSRKRWRERYKRRQCC